MTTATTIYDADGNTITIDLTDPDTFPEGVTLAGLRDDAAHYGDLDLVALIDSVSDPA